MAISIRMRPEVTLEKANEDSRDFWTKRARIAIADKMWQRFDLLNPDQVRYVRTSLKPSGQLAGEFSLDRRAIDRVRRRETYQDVPDAPPTADPPAALRRNDYVLGDGLHLMGQLPDGSAATVVAMPPLFRPPHASQSQVGKARSSHVDRQKSIIREGRRVAGPNGVLLCVHRYDLTADLLDVGPGGIPEFSPEQVIVWDTLAKEDPPSATTRRIPGQHRAIYVFAGDRWRLPLDIRDQVGDWGDLWPCRAQLRDGDLREFPEELADRLIAMGRGRVLDPFAELGALGLAAARQNREWTLFGKSAVDQRTFRRNLQAFYQERALPTKTVVQSVRPPPQSRSTGKGRSRPPGPNQRILL